MSWISCAMRLPLATALLLLAAAPAVADTIWTGSGSGRGLEQEVNVQGVEQTPGEGAVLVYLVNGNRASTPLARVQQIRLDGGGDFSDAEAAYAGGDWARAADLYDRAAGGGANPEWVRRRSVRRLVDAAASAGLFDRATAGFLRLVELDPASAAAAQPEPSAGATPEQLEAADAAVGRALGGGSLAPEQRKQLLTFRLALANARGDDAAAAAAVEALAPLVGDAPGEAPADRDLFARVTLGRAALALQQGRPEEAASLIRDHAGVFETPGVQSAAMFALAQAARAGASSREEQLGAAVAYMKVVALFKSAGDRGGPTPEVPPALLAAAAIHEELGLAEDAADLYRSLTSDHADTPQAAEAQGRLDALAE